jgi:protein involved in sex pheromone biosynthesis
MKRILILLSFTMALSACSNNQNDASNNATNSEQSTEEVRSEGLKREVMDLHDKVMPEMGPMSKLQGQLLQAAQNSPDSAQLQTAAADLKQAKAAMMQWMRNFSGQYSDELSEAEKVAFLEAEKSKMEEIDQETQAALQNGRAMLKELGQNSAKSPQ